jgi:hypothetical protein
LSFFGSLKTLIALYLFKLNVEGVRVPHILRGDFDLFYNRSFLNKLFCKLIFFNLDKRIVLSPSQFVYFNKLNNELSISLRKRYYVKFFHSKQNKQLLKVFK